MRYALAALAAALLAIPASASAAEVHLVNQTWVCSGPVDLDLVKVEVNQAGVGDGISLRTGCTGRIARIEVDILFGADGVKVTNSSLNAAHDLVIEGGYINVIDHPEGVHQDGVQAMGGRDILFRNITCYGPLTALGCFAVQQAGGRVTMPTNIICDGCSLQPQKGLRIGRSISSGARNTVTCGISITEAAVDPVVENVTNECGPVPPPPPPPPPAPPPPPCAGVCRP